jgi:hypothetical protein
MEQINEGNTRKKSEVMTLVLAIVILALAVFVFGGLKNKNANVGNLPVENEPVSSTQGIRLCFADIKTVGDPKNAIEDEFTLVMDLKGSEVKGELNLRPAEKDSKTGKFEGVVSPVDPIAMARTVDAWWDTFAEGTNVLEELRIVFGEGTANIGMGGMKDRGDGTYIYIDKANINYSLSLSDIDCNILDERKKVDQYLRENIVAISPVQASLGGKWYVLRNTTDTNSNTGYVVYEDGHTEERRAFSYQTDEAGNIASLTLK